LKEEEKEELAKKKVDNLGAKKASSKTTRLLEVRNTPKIFEVDTDASE